MRALWLAVGLAGVLACDALTGPEPQPPTASFILNCEELECIVDATSSVDSDGGITRYEWDFGDGSTRAGVTATHTYATSGDYTVTLTVTDADGLSDTTTLAASVVGPLRLSWDEEVTDLFVSADSVSCEFRISVEATEGRAGDAAVWQRSSGQWIDATSGQRFDFTLSQTDMLDLFGADRVRTGETLTTFRVAWWDRTFTLLFTFRYRMPDNTQRSDNVFVECQ